MRGATTTPLFVDIGSITHLYPYRDLSSVTERATLRMTASLVAYADRAWYLSTSTGQDNGLPAYVCGWGGITLQQPNKFARTLLYLYPDRRCVSHLYGSGVVSSPLRCISGACGGVSPRAYIHLLWDICHPSVIVVL